MDLSSRWYGSQTTLCLIVGKPIKWGASERVFLSQTTRATPLRPQALEHRTYVVAKPNGTDKYRIYAPDLPEAEQYSEWTTSEADLGRSKKLSRGPIYRFPMKPKARAHVAQSCIVRTGAGPLRTTHVNNNGRNPQHRLRASSSHTSPTTSAALLPSSPSARASTPPSSPTSPLAEAWYAWH
jgi:hypothetical protein